MLKDFEIVEKTASRLGVDYILELLEKDDSYRALIFCKCLIEALHKMGFDEEYPDIVRSVYVDKNNEVRIYVPAYGYVSLEPHIFGALMIDISHHACSNIYDFTSIVCKYKK